MNHKAYRKEDIMTTTKLTGRDAIDYTDVHDISGSYVWTLASWSDGQEVTDEEREQLQTYLTAHVPEGVDFIVRQPWGSEVEGLYRDGQILGYSIEAPEEIDHLINAALDANVH